MSAVSLKGYIAYHPRDVSKVPRAVIALAVMTSCPPYRNLNSTIHAFFCKREVDRASEFVGYETAYESSAVAG